VLDSGSRARRAGDVTAHARDHSVGLMCLGVRGNRLEADSGGGCGGSRHETLMMHAQVPHYEHTRILRDREAPFQSARSIRAAYRKGIRLRFRNQDVDL
jgi:hypothetical protein